MAMLAILVLPLMYLGWTAVAVVLPSAAAAMNNAGPAWLHRSALRLHVGNRQQRLGLCRLSGNTFFYNLTLASAMFVGRFFMIVPAMAMAGSLAAKKSIPPSAGTFPTTGGLFVGLVVGVILIIGGLTFFPALALGPDRRAPRDERQQPVLTDHSELLPWKSSRKRNRQTPAATMLDPKIVGPAIGSAFVKLDPRMMVKNPVMFVVEVVAALTTVIFLRDLVTGGERPRLYLSDHPVAVVHGAVRQFRRSRGRRPRQGAGRIAAQDPHREPGQASDRRGQGLPPGAGHEPEGRRYRAGRSRRQYSLRRRGDRRRCLGQRGRHHRRIRARDPGIRRRSFRGHRRHAGAVGLDPRAHHRSPRLDLHRPHDQAGRRRRAAEDAERDRAQYPARGSHHHLRVRDGDDPELCGLCRAARSRWSSWWRCSSR